MDHDPVNVSHALALPRVRVADVIRAVCDVTGYSAAELLGDCRSRELMTPRHVAISVAKEVTGRSFPEIGRHFKRDHSSVFHAVRAIAEQRAQPQVAALYEQVKARAVSVAANPAAPFDRAPPPERKLPKGERPPAPEPHPAINKLELAKLRANGWSVSGLARRYGVAEKEIRIAIGEPLEKDRT